MRSLDSVRSYFNREAARFDAIYRADKPLWQRIGDALMRGVIHERYRLGLSAIAGSGSILDVGCGSGRYGIELARRGARRCVGIDVADEMIQIARTEAERAGVADRCVWEVTDFLSWKSDERFDCGIAMGYFDYLEDPLPHLCRLVEQVTGLVFASFPKRWELRVPIRKLRFFLERGYVRFYGEGEVRDLFRQVGSLDYLSLLDLGRDYIALYNADAAARGR